MPLPDSLLTDDAPPGFVEWARSKGSFADAWDGCTSADWMYWMAKHRVVDDRTERALVAAAACLFLASDFSDFVPTLTPPEAQIAFAWALKTSPWLNETSERMADYIRACVLLLIVCLPITLYAQKRWHLSASTIDAVGTAVAMVACSVLGWLWRFPRVWLTRRRQASKAFHFPDCFCRARQRPRSRRARCAAVRRRQVCRGLRQQFRLWYATGRAPCV